MVEDRSVLTRTARQPDRTWAYGADPDQVAEVFAADRAAPARSPVVLVHGGFWRPEYDRTHLRPMAAALADRGHEVTLVEYRRRPGDPDVTVADVQSAIAAAHARAGAPAVVMGHSAGGHLALLAAAESGEPLLGCLALAPVADLVLADELGLDGDAVPAFVGGSGTSRPDLDPSHRPPVVRTTVVHGQVDSLVPLALADAYCSRTRTRLVEIPAVAHFELIDPLSAAWPVVLAELGALASFPGGE